MNKYEQMNVETKQLIQEQFINLLSGKDFKKISIQNIATACDINRGTFYLHYLDKYDLLEQMITQLLEDLQSKLDQLEPASVINAIDDQKELEETSAIFSYIQTNAKFFTVLMTKELPFQFDHHFKQLLINQFNKKETAPMFNYNKIPKHYLANFASSAYLGLIDEWLKSGLKESPQELSKYYYEIIDSIRNI